MDHDLLLLLILLNITSKQQSSGKFEDIVPHAQAIVHFVICRGYSTTPLFVRPRDSVHKIKLHMRDSGWQKGTFQQKFCLSSPATCQPFGVLGACDRPVTSY